jgi:hypothetical protein
MIHSCCLTALMIGQQGVEVESMLANQHAVGSVTVTRRADSAHSAPLAANNRPIFVSLPATCGADGSAWSLRRDGPPGVKDFQIDRDHPYLRQCLPISTGQAGPSGVPPQRRTRVGYEK